MTNIEHVVRQINRDLVPQFEERLREHLANQDREWLVEQIVRLTLDAHSLQEMDRRRVREEDDRKRRARARRVAALALDREKLGRFLRKYGGYDRGRLVREGYLKRSCPRKGTELIGASFRTGKGETLLELAKDILYGLLFGDATTNTRFQRAERELLTLTVPRAKVEAIDFMKATTELSALGTWQDPRGAANDLQADNVVLEVEYGEVAEELIGDGVV